MANKKHFLQDRTALLLVSADSFLAAVAVVLVLLKLNTAQGTDNYIISYRSSLGLSAYKTGSVWDILSFLAFAVLVLLVSVVLSYRIYSVKRELSLTLLALTVPLLLFLIVVTNALLVLR